MSKRIRLFLIATSVIGILITYLCMNSELISQRTGEILILFFVCLFIPATYGVSHRSNCSIGEPEDVESH